jgi:hypothetical protein
MTGRQFDPEITVITGAVGDEIGGPLYISRIEYINLGADNWFIGCINYLPPENKILSGRDPGRRP